MPFDSGNIPKETLDYLASKSAQRVNKGGSGGIIIFLLVICAIGVIGALMSGTSKDENDKTAQAKSLAQAQPSVKIPYQPEKLIADAKDAMASSEYKFALDDIGKLSESDAKRPMVRSMFAKATYEERVAELKEQRLARIAYAQDDERTLLGAGEDYTVRAQGANADILSVTFILINRPYVYKIENDEDLNAKWASLGFKSVHLSDGFDHSWSYKLE